jgi:hypothetical protein
VASYVLLHKSSQEYMWKNLKRLLSRSYRYWIEFGKLLGLITTTVVLCIAYFLLIGPFSLVARIFGKDLLDERLDVGGSSYWKDRMRSEISVENGRHQF